MAETSISRTDVGRLTKLGVARPERKTDIAQHVKEGPLCSVRGRLDEFSDTFASCESHS
jgi:hypothetical protein